MTRINVGIHPHELPTKLLLAEHRELKRIPNMVRQGRVSMKNIPPTFTLGTGHVKFFYDKIDYLNIRYHQLYNECIKRALNVQYYGESFDGIHEDLMNPYEETVQDRNILIERIQSKGFSLLQSDYERI